MTAPGPGGLTIADLPTDARALLLHAWGILQQDRGRPSRRRDALLLILQQTGDVPEYQPQFTALQHDTDPVEQVRRLVPAVLPAPTGAHAGVLVISDCLLLRGDVDDEWAEIVTGAPREDGQLWRVALGALVSGWRVGLQARGEEAPIAVVAPPGQTRLMGGDLNDALLELNQRILAGA